MGKYKVQEFMETEVHGTTQFQGVPDKGAYEAPV